MINRWLRVVAFAVVVVIPVAALMLLRESAPESIPAIETNVQPIVAAPVERMITDEKPVNVTLTITEGLPLRAPGWSGITGTYVPPDLVASGDEVAVIDGVRRIAFATPEPFHRRLVSLDSGSDVVQLHAMLRTLGYLEHEPEDPGQLMWPTTVALTEFAADLGVVNPDGSFDPAWVVWLPSAPFAVADWSFEAGGLAPAPGTIIARGPGAVTSAVLAAANQAEPLALDPAIEWTFEAGELSLPVDAARMAIAPEDALPLVALLDEEQNQVGGVVRRAEVLGALGVPATAVQAGSGGAVCVWIAKGAAYEAVPVTVSGSRAGVANITSGLTPEMQVLANPAEILETSACP